MDLARSWPARSQFRFPVTWNATLRCAAWEHSALVTTVNLARGGAFFLTGAPAVVGARVAVSLRLPTGESVEVSGTVRHVAWEGVGGAFDDLESDGRALEALAFAEAEPV